MRIKDALPSFELMPEYFNNDTLRICLTFSAKFKRIINDFLIDPSNPNRFAVVDVSNRTFVQTFLVETKLFLEIACFHVTPDKKILKLYQGPLNFIKIVAQRISIVSKCFKALLATPETET